MKNSPIPTFLSITLFYFFESIQLAYFNVLAPTFLNQGIYSAEDIGSLSASYLYGCMIGLIPVGYTLDHYPLRKIMLWAILGSVISAFLLLFSSTFLFEWIARFLCGFFGGAFSFVGGIRILASLFPKRFTFFMGLFISAGMLGGLMCQYPLLISVNQFGIRGGETIVACLGLIVMIYSFFYLHPVEQTHSTEKRSAISSLKTFFSIVKNRQNGLDCLMVILMDTPVSMVGTLWGIVLLTNLYHYTDVESAWVITALFIGLMIGSPVWGELADRRNHPAWIIALGSFTSFFCMIFLILFEHPSVMLSVLLFFMIGFFSSTQTLGFTWLTKNMNPEFIGQNSAFNSMLFMLSNGGLKQWGALLLSLPPLFMARDASLHLLLFIAFCLFFSGVYAVFRPWMIGQQESVILR